jgi:hypothetical protein
VICSESEICEGFLQLFGRTGKPEITELMCWMSYWEILLWSLNLDASNLGTLRGPVAPAISSTRTPLVFCQNVSGQHYFRIADHPRTGGVPRNEGLSRAAAESPWLKSGNHFVENVLSKGFIKGSVSL